MYFPQLAGKAETGAIRAAALLILQYQPWKNLTILGGQMLFSLSGVVGQITDDWRDFPGKPLLWNASVNAGLRLGETFGLRVQAGAGRSSGGRVAPFLSVDIGSFRY
jgi:NTE family protein